MMMLVELVLVVSGVVLSFLEVVVLFVVLLGMMVVRVVVSSCLYLLIVMLVCVFGCSLVDIRLQSALDRYWYV